MQRKSTSSMARGVEWMSENAFGWSDLLLLLLLWVQPVVPMRFQPDARAR